MAGRPSPLRLPPLPPPYWAVSVPAPQNSTPERSGPVTAVTQTSRQSHWRCQVPPQQQLLFKALSNLLLPRCLWSTSLGRVFPITSVAGEAEEGGLPHSVPRARTHQPRCLIMKAAGPASPEDSAHSPLSPLTGPTKPQRAGLFA